MGKTNYFMKLALICGVTFILSLCAGVMWTHKDHNKMYVYVNNLSNGQTHVENTVSYKNVAFHCVRRIYIIVCFFMPFYFTRRRECLWK